MKSVCTVALIVVLNFGQAVFSSNSQEKPMFPESWYRKQLKHTGLFVCAQKCPVEKESCMLPCLEDYCLQLRIYTIRQAIKECSGSYQLNESFEYIDSEKNPEAYIKKVTKPFIRSMELMQYSNIKQCVDKKMEGENTILSKILGESKNDLTELENKHPLITKRVKIKTCLKEFEIEQPLASTHEMLKCLKNKFINK